jgi:anti-anti-sigma factor
MAHLGNDDALMLVHQAADGTVHVVLRGELDIVSVGALQPQIAEALGHESSRVVVDATRLTYVDSSGLAVLLRLASRHGDLEIRDASDLVRQIIRVAGLATRFRLESEPRPGHRRRFPARLLSVRESRAFVLEALNDVEARVREVAAVLVAELATNAVLHARSPFEVAVCVTDDAVRVEVADEGSGMPLLLEAGSDSERGRGLKIVDGLARSWGVNARGDEESKTVWFELARPDAAAGLEQGDVERTAET